MRKIELHNYELHVASSFETVDDYTLKLTFDDNTEQTINFEPILYGPLFEPLRDLAIFNQVKLDSDLGTLVWPTGTDIDPTVLHDWSDHVEAIIERLAAKFDVP